MTLKTPPRMVVVKKEEKESKLRELLQIALAQRAVSGLPGAPILRLIAQSCASPVVRAVLALQTELTAAGAEVRIILAKTDGADASQFCRSTVVRSLADTRFHDAHEMLVLEPVAAWIGDSMRREPATRDSFELHTSDCADTADGVGSSFDKFWGHAHHHRICAHDIGAELELVADLAGLPSDASSAPQVLTRH
jgi:hypothetical protein